MNYNNSSNDPNYYYNNQLVNYKQFNDRKFQDNQLENLHNNYYINNYSDNNDYNDNHEVQEEETDERDLIFNDNNNEFVKFKNDVLEWIKLDDDIRTLQLAMTERKKRKNDLTPTILEYMKRFEISDLNTKGGKLQFVKSVTTKGLNKQVLISRLGDFFKDANKGEKAANFILDGRTKQETFRLKRVVKKEKKGLFF